MMKPIVHEKFLLGLTPPRQVQLSEGKLEIYKRKAPLIPPT